jgi:hypothetical protein
MRYDGAGYLQCRRTDTATIELCIVSLDELDVPVEDVWLNVMWPVSVGCDVQSDKRKKRKKKIKKRGGMMSNALIDNIGHGGKVVHGII